ncbi:putative apyrase 7 [Iris pallida]|uniref:Apyrase 7 n=1 Tax=Iris pallida TaxID=29817 RepID=A0AAX6H0Z0_IRIPA|nr:putative apyrase 7 [Iris pallida]
MRYSASLQDLPTSIKVEPEGDFDLEFNKNYVRNKHIRALQRDGAASSFSKEKSSITAPSIRKKLKRSTIIGLVCLLLLSVSLYGFLRYYNSSLSHIASEYYVVLDCGSTGTRVYVYEWSIVQGKDHKNLPIVLRSLPESLEKRSSGQSGRAYQRMETEPGFGKLVRNKTGLKAAIKPLLQWAEKQIPKHAHKRTSLFVYATAGVRRLPTSDSEWLLEKTWSIVKKSSFLCKRNWVKIITGMEEAYYGWIALNYHTGMFGSLPAKGTYGSLDLGGSSLQVTFETEKPVHDETGISLNIGAISHHLSAYSLSGYGLNDAFDKSVVHLFKSQGTAATGSNNGRIELTHPCLQTGYREKYICSQCSALNQEGSPLVGGKFIDKGRPGVPVELIGAPQWENCSALAKTTVSLSEWANFSSGIDCEIKPCALSDNLPVPQGQFYAMSGFFVVYRFFNLTSEDTLDDILQKGQEFCAKPWEVAKNSVAPQPFIEQYCFRAPYVVSLLREGLHIVDDQVVIGSGSITWTLGVALLEAGRAFSTRTEFRGYNIFQTDINPTILLILCLISAVLLFGALSWASNCMPRFFRRSYLPVFRHSASTSFLSFQRRSPTGDGKVKTPLSPTIADSEQHPFGMGYGLGGSSSIQLMESPFQPIGFSHSISSGSLGQMQFGSGSGSSFMTPLRGQATLQSRRSQSREDLISSLVEAQAAKV